MFRDRLHAGQELAKKLEKYRGQDAVVLGIPRGGVPVGKPIADMLSAPLDVIIPRKLPIPWSPEVGFGAVTSTGDVVLNEDILREISLSQEEIDKIVSEVRSEIDRRMKVYRGERPLPELKDKVVIIVDDGLATGYTMIAAIQAVKKYGPKKIIAAAPVSPKDSEERVKKHADEVLTLWSKPTYSFAVASFYDDFHDMRDQEVTEILNSYS